MAKIGKVAKTYIAIYREFTDDAANAYFPVNQREIGVDIMIDDVAAERDTAECAGPHRFAIQQLPGESRCERYIHFACGQAEWRSSKSAACL